MTLEKGKGWPQIDKDVPYLEAKRLSSKTVYVYPYLEAGESVRFDDREEYKKQQHYAYAYGNSLKTKKVFKSKWMGTHGRIWRIS